MSLKTTFRQDRSPARGLALGLVMHRILVHTHIHAYTIYLRMKH